MAVTAPARVPRSSPRPSPARRPARKPAPKPRRRAAAQPAGHLIPLAVGRTAVALRGLPDSGLVTRMMRGRAWIAVLGVLLTGIVALNVGTLTLSASAGRVAEQIRGIEQENSALREKLAQRLSSERVVNTATSLGLVVPPTDSRSYVRAGRGDVKRAAARLAAYRDASG